LSPLNLSLNDVDCFISRCTTGYQGNIKGEHKEQGTKMRATDFFNDECDFRYGLVPKAVVIEIWDAHAQTGLGIDP
jgi:hypothetical protein